MPLFGTHGLDYDIDVSADAGIYHLRYVAGSLACVRFKIRTVHIDHDSGRGSVCTY